MKKRTYKPYQHFLCIALTVALSSIYAISLPNPYPTRELEPYYDLSLTTPERDSLFRNLQDPQKSLKSLHQYFSLRQASSP